MELNTDSEAVKPPSRTFKIVCTSYPEIFALDRPFCKSYFRQYGKVLRLIFKPKQRAIVVEYTNENDYMNALSGPSEYEGQSFKVEPFEPPTPPPTKSELLAGRRKSRDKVVKKHKLVYLKPDEVAKRHISYVDKNEINEELEAMAMYLPNAPEISSQPSNAGPARTLKLNRVWKKSTAIDSVDKPKKVTVVKKKVQSSGSKEKIKMLTAEQLDLLKVIKGQAHTVDEKYKVLDARDKLSRLSLRRSNLKSSPTVGTCPDMCPEKERLLREIQHQVSLYEQDSAGRHSMDHSKAVKQYSRSSADQESPLPHELRPVAVLEMTMVYLMCNIMNLADSEFDVNLGEWFHFLWDRTRGIRKDITQQALCCQKSVQLVEQCARFHIHCSARLMGEDPSVFDQKINTENLTKCLQTLKYMYHDLELKGEQCPKEAEFRAYIILLNMNDGNFMWEVQQHRSDIQKSPEIRFALQVYSAFEKRNYVKFFKLIRTTTYLNACILMRYFVQVRTQALETLVRCFTPPKSISFYPIAQITRSLLFDDEEATIDFMQTYGIGVNKDSTSFLIERSSFIMPDYSYVLERSRIVEQKRQHSVGVVVNGGEISPELYMEMQSHQVYDSFDESGYLVHDDMFNELETSIEERLLDDGDSRESTPERKVNVVSNIFAPKAVNKTSSAPPNIFSQPKEGVKPDPVNIFASSVPMQMDRSPERRSTKPPPSNIFAAPPAMLKGKDEVDAPKVQDNIFALSQPKTAPSIFDRKLNTSAATSQPFSTQPNIFAAPSRDPRLQPREPIRSQPPSLFTPKPPEPSKTGGFTFSLNRPLKTTEVPNIFASDLNRNALEQEKRKQQEKALKVQEEEERKRQEEIRRRNEEAAEKRKLEMERLKRQEEEMRRKEEEERLRRERLLEEERRRKDEEMRRKLAEMEKRRREAEEERKKQEIKDTVYDVVNQMVERVVTNLREEALRRIREKIKQRMLLRLCRKWRWTTANRVKKRKALDCKPIFVHTRTLAECAQDFHAKSESLTLSDIKRYKYGRPLEIPLVDDPPIVRLKLFNLTYPTLRRRLCELKEKWHQHIYWKVVVSIPDINEMIAGLHKLEQNLKSHIDWQLNKYGNTVYIEHQKTVTYCVEKHQGLRINSDDANAFIFIGTNFNDLMCRRIFENLKNFGVHVQIPVVLILEDGSGCTEYLDGLKASGIVSDYMIYTCNINSPVLPSIIDNGLIFLAKGVERYPPLELDSLQGFLSRNLCTDIWQNAASYCKWNRDYNCCMRDPNLVITLYNDGLDLLAKIVSDKSCKEYASFPEVFTDYLPDKTPDYLPCDYRYFPSFWQSPQYEKHLKLVMQSLKLPKFLEKWPPKNEDELKDSISTYCKQIFSSPDEPQNAILNVLQENSLNNCWDETIWVEPIQIISREKLKELDLNLPKQFISDVFTTLVVVYNVNVLSDYASSEWFYRNNPTIEGYKKVISSKSRETINVVAQVPSRKRGWDVDESEDLLKVIDKAESLLRAPKNACLLENKSKVEALNKSIEDLEDSIRVVKRMDDLNLFSRFIED